MRSTDTVWVNATIDDLTTDLHLGWLSTSDVIRGGSGRKRAVEYNATYFVEGLNSFTKDDTGLLTLAVKEGRVWIREGEFNSPIPVRIASSLFVELATRWVCGEECSLRLADCIEQERNGRFWYTVYLLRRWEHYRPMGTGDRKVRRFPMTKEEVCK